MMMNVIVLLAVLLSCPAMMQAQSSFESVNEQASGEVGQDNLDYHPMVVDGKSWTVNLPTMVNPERWVCGYFDGDTLINGKKMAVYYYGLVGSKPVVSGAYYEEGRKVYVYNFSKQREDLVFDFSLTRGETSRIGGVDFEVVEELEVEAQGVQRRALRIAYVYNNYRFKELWVEGVGTREGLLPFYHMLSRSTALDEFGSCSVLDSVLFTGEDFARYPDDETLGIAENVSGSIKEAGQVYDLQGRSVSQGHTATGAVGVVGQLPRGVYIQNGRKFVVK